MSNKVIKNSYEESEKASNSITYILKDVGEISAMVALSTNISILFLNKPDSMLNVFIEKIRKNAKILKIMLKEGTLYKDGAFNVEKEKTH